MISVLMKSFADSLCSIKKHLNSNMFLLMVINFQTSYSLLFSHLLNLLTNKCITRKESIYGSVFLSMTLYEKQNGLGSMSLSISEQKI